MRTSTFFVSFLVHTLVIGGVVVTRLVATDVLPEPPRASTFILVTPEVPAIPPPAPAVPRAQPAVAVNPSAAPVTEPTEIRPERPPRVVDDAPALGDLVSPGLEVPGGLGSLDVPAPPPQPAPVAPLRVGGDIRPPQKVRHVAPDYPTIARSAGVSGIVILEALIGEDGSVRDVKVLRSVALLDQAAVDAVRQWRFTPPLLNGAPVPVLMTVTVSFSLSR